MEESFASISVTDFSERLASKAPVPGGGGGSAAAGALAAALGEMVCNLTLGKPKYAAFEEDVSAYMAELKECRAALLELIDDDAKAFEPLYQAYAIPKDDPDRDAVMQQALHLAIVPPLSIMYRSVHVIETLSSLLPKCSALAVSDIGVAAVLAKAALEGAALNVYVNTASIANREAALLYNKTAASYLVWVDKADAVYAAVAERLQQPC